MSWVGRNARRMLLRVSDTRMSGTSYGACILRVAPEAQIPVSLPSISAMPMAAASASRSNATLRQADIIARLTSLSVESRENTSEQFHTFVATETAKWRRVVREANIKLG
jgi:hypothetical protein